MQVKKFEAPTMNEALGLIKTELGPDAIILSTKRHRKGFGLLSKSSVEITAAVSDKSLAKKRITEKAVPQQTKQKIDSFSATKQSEVYESFTDHYLGKLGRWKNKKQDKERTTSVNVNEKPRYVDIEDEPTGAGYNRNGRVSTTSTSTTAPTTAKTEPTASAIQAKLQVTPQVTSQTVLQAPVHADADSIKIEALKKDVDRLKQVLEELKSEQASISDAAITKDGTDEIQNEYRNLLQNGIDRKFAMQLIRRVSADLPRSTQHQKEQIQEALAMEIMNDVKVGNPLDMKAGDPQRVYAFIGPTGVGKTTTIAKIASHCILQKGLRVGLINIDSYKVAALDQLATYAKILNVPFRQVSSAAELDRALTEFKPLDVVLIDTSGRSQKDTEALAQMNKLLVECPAIRPQLVLSATTRDDDLYDIVARFKIFNPSGIIFCKLDETSTFGCLYNVAFKTGTPLTHFTVGQRVPEDIEIASKERVVDLILDL